MADDLLNAREVARKLGVSERTVWQLTKDGDLPHVRVGKQLRYRPSDVQAWIDGRVQRGFVGGGPPTDDAPPGDAAESAGGARNGVARAGVNGAA